MKRARQLRAYHVLAAETGNGGEDQCRAHCEEQNHHPEPPLLHPQPEHSGSKYPRGDQPDHEGGYAAFRFSQACISEVDGQLG